jgi:hypothetical protein
MPVLSSSALPSPIVRLLLSRKHREITKYYKKQENLLKDFSEMETMKESGCLDHNAPSEALTVASFVVMEFVTMHPIFLDHVRC